MPKTDLDRTKETDRRPSDDDMFRGRRDDMDDMSNESEEFDEDAEDLDEEGEEDEGSF